MKLYKQDNKVIIQWLKENKDFKLKDNSFSNEITYKVIDKII